VGLIRKGLYFGTSGLASPNSKKQRLVMKQLAVAQCSRTRRQRARAARTAGTNCRDSGVTKVMRAGGWADWLPVEGVERLKCAQRLSGATVSGATVSGATAGKAITVGADPVAIAITPDGATAYVANAGDNTVSAIDTGTNKPTQITN
jgi:DNA-binding beta-propeller fold protein YncE